MDFVIGKRIDAFVWECSYCGEIHIDACLGEIDTHELACPCCGLLNRVYVEGSNAPHLNLGLSIEDRLKGVY